jgi:hypothetical protein
MEKRIKEIYTQYAYICRYIGNAHISLLAGYNVYENQSFAYNTTRWRF